MAVCRIEIIGGDVAWPMQPQGREPAARVLERTDRLPRARRVYLPDERFVGRLVLTRDVIDRVATLVIDSDQPPTVFFAGTDFVGPHVRDAELQESPYLSFTANRWSF